MDWITSAVSHILKTDLPLHVLQTGRIGRRDVQQGVRQLTRRKSWVGADSDVARLYEAGYMQKGSPQCYTFIREPKPSIHTEHCGD